LIISPLINRLLELGGSVSLGNNGRIRAQRPKDNAEAKAIVEKLKRHCEAVRSLLTETHRLDVSVEAVAPPVPTECYCCHGKLFWRSVYMVVICWKCHPPAKDSLVTAILWNGETKWHQ
jgi:hypothetical protein